MSQLLPQSGQAGSDERVAGEPTSEMQDGADERDAGLQAVGPAATTDSEPLEVPSVLTLVEPTVVYAPIKGRWLAPDSPALQQAQNPSPADEEARQLARRSYADLARTARGELDAFVERANRVTEQMAGAYRARTGEIVQGHERDQDVIDRSADRTVNDIEGTAAAAQASLALTTRQARRAVEAAGRRAYGLIAADDLRAAQEIGAVVAGLVSGHLAAFNGAIADVSRAAAAALVELRAWSNSRATHFPTDIDPMRAAKNEARQLRIPGWVDQETTNMNDRVTRKAAAWTETRDTTVCGLTCNYRGAIETERRRLNTQGRTSVGSALGAARGSLADQAATATRTLHDLRQSYLQQVRTQASAAKSRLNVQARGAIGGAHHESRSAIAGVQGAARDAMPTFSQGVAGLAQGLRQSALRGGQALRLTAQRAPADVLRALQRSAAQLGVRLDGNLARLLSSLGERVAVQLEQSGDQVAEWETSATQRSAQAQESFDQNLAGFEESFGGIAGTVSQASAAWAQTLAVQMAAFIAARRAEAQAALTGLLTGRPVEVRAAGAPAAPVAGETPGEGADCGHCAAATPTAAGSPGAAPATAPATGAAGAGPAQVALGPGGGAAAPRGLTAEAELEVRHMNERAQPATLFSERLTAVGTQVEENLRARAVAVAQKFEGGFAGTVDEEGVIAQLRGLTELKGHALDVVSYPTVGKGTLDSHLRHYLEADSDDYATASAYLRGDAREGARRELADSVGFFNDDEARIEATMRALSPTDLAALGADPKIRDEVRDALGGTDLQVFDALVAGDYARADAYRLRDEVDEARRDQNADAVHSAIERYTGAPGEGDWRSTQEMSADTRRTQVVTALGGIVSDADVALGAEGRDVSTMSAQDRAVAYVSREIPVVVGGTGEHMQVEMRGLTGAKRDLATALLLRGERSVEARAARLGVEAQRTGDDPKTVNIDRAVYDERFAPDRPGASPEERAENERQRQEARDDRARVLLLAARYAAPGEAGAGPSAPLDRSTITRSGFRTDDAQVDAARQALIARFRGRYEDDALGARAVAGLLTDERPTPQTASLVMQHAMHSHAGTDEALMFQFTERMTRREAAAMSAQFQADTGNSLEAELGVYGEGGFFTELSGDDRLRMERALRGVPQTDTERLENAAFALAQQRRETGTLGAWLAEGTLAERVMASTEQRLERLAGGPITLSRRGDLLAPLRNFDAEGTYTGRSRDDFLATTSVAQTVAENYAKRIDAFADVLTTGIAIVGAIAAAVITVATGGAAAPLIAAAIATGLASMSANYAIKGGRYGWEQAGIDLGMTAVQAITAGVGAQLGAAAQVASKGAAAASTASRSLASLARLFTGNPVVDQIIIGAVTGSVGGVANVAFDERTWERSGGNAVGALFSGLLKGALAGGATAALTNSIEALGRNGAAISKRAQELAARGGFVRGAVGLAGRGVGGVGRGINAALNASTGGGPLSSAGSMAARGLARGGISAVSGMGGRATELLYDSSTGHYRGDAGDALLDIGRAGARSFVQGIGEGAGEAVGQGVHNSRLVDAAGAINHARERRGLAPLEGHPLQEGSPLRSAAEDLMFLNQHGRNAGDPKGGSRNLAHVATHGGLGAPLAKVRPPAIVEDAMRAELMRHVPAELHGSLVETPIRVLPEAEYRALTRSESGPVVTLIEDGHPVVVIREGTPIPRLADEGPHLIQARDADLTPRVAQLDEAILARWDSLDLETQLDLYRTKISLEIDAHQRIQDSLDAELRSGRIAESDLDRHGADLDRNATILRNLRTRQKEVARIGPEQRAAIEAGKRPRPQYLEQPARLFSKDDAIPGRRTAEERLSADILETMLTEVVEKRGMSRRGGLVEEEFHSLPELTEALGLGGRTPDRSEVPPAVAAWARRVARERFGRQLQEALLDPGMHNRMTQAAAERLSDAQLAHIERTGELPRGVEFHHLLTVADFPEFAHLGAEVGTALPRSVHRQAGHAMETRRHVEAGTFLDPDAETRPIGFHNEPEGRAAGAAAGAGRVPPESPVLRASAHDPEAHADAMREALMRHVPPEQREALAGVEIDVLPAEHYRRLTESERGPVVTLMIGGEPRVVIREGTPISRLSDEGPHLSQAIEAPTRASVARHDETVMGRWHELDLDTQIDLYRNKIALEIDAHERIVRSLEAEEPTTATERTQLAAEIDRAETTLRNLRARHDEVAALGPTERAAIRAGTAARPDYLDQPARLFSKDAPQGERLALTDTERERLRASRLERKIAERAERSRRGREREEAEQRARIQQEARERRQARVDEEVEGRRRAGIEGRVSSEQDIRDRLTPVVAELNLDPGELAAAIVQFREELGGVGRRVGAQEVIDSLRNRVREGRPPRYGDMEGLVSEIIVEQNAVAVQQMREHIARSRPDAVLGVQRGGAFLAEALSTGAEGFPTTVPVAKYRRPREGQPDLVQRTPLLEAEIRRRIVDGGESRFAIVDFYMGGVFAGELQTMILNILRDHPHAEFEVMWMRETAGFERVVIRPAVTDPEFREWVAALQEGVAFEGRVSTVGGRVKIRQESPAVTLAPLRGDVDHPNVRTTEFPVDVALGDDMRAVLESSPTEPVRLFDRDGELKRTIPIGTPDPVTGRPLSTTREIMIRVMQGFRFDDEQTQNARGQR
jgi:hypothetical protein